MMSCRCLRPLTSVDTVVTSVTRYLKPAVTFAKPTYSSPRPVFAYEYDFIDANAGSKSYVSTRPTVPARHHCPLNASSPPPANRHLCVPAVLAAAVAFLFSQAAAVAGNSSVDLFLCKDEHSKKISVQFQYTEKIKRRRCGKVGLKRKRRHKEFGFSRWDLNATSRL